VSSVPKKSCQDYRIIFDVDDTTRTVTAAVVDLQAPQRLSSRRRAYWPGSGIRAGVADHAETDQVAESESKSARFLALGAATTSASARTYA
jgi:hypothetical protein